MSTILDNDGCSVHSGPKNRLYKKKYQAKYYRECCRMSYKTAQENFTNHKQAVLKLKEQTSPDKTKIEVNLGSVVMQPFDSSYADLKESSEGYSPRMSPGRKLSNDMVTKFTAKVNLRNKIAAKQFSEIQSPHAHTTRHGDQDASPSQFWSEISKKCSSVPGSTRKAIGNRLGTSGNSNN